MKGFSALRSIRKSWLTVAILAGLAYLLSSQVPVRSSNSQYHHVEAVANDSCMCGFFTIPFDSIVPGDAPLLASQQNADCFGWWEFITLNWPTAQGAGFGDPGDTGPVQWETYITKDALFPPQGEAPPPWGSTALPLPAEAMRINKTANAHKLLTAASKFGRNRLIRFDSTATGEAFPFNAPNWLGAQNGTNVWYEIRLNKDIYDFTVTNKYYNADNQLAAIQKGNPIVFPSGSYPQGPVGAIELKAAWMEVPDPSNSKWERYKLSRAMVMDANTGQYRFTAVALVGLHIIHKTQSQPTWIWATFEHVDNVPDAAGDVNSSYNFYDPDCQPRTVNVPDNCLPQDSISPVTVTCTANTPPPYYLCKDGPGPVPIQVTRQTPIDSEAKNVNALMQKAIAKAYPRSVWQYYQLVNVIWSTSPTANPQQPDTVPKPLSSMLPVINVANTALETYAQTKTCTDCHRYATIAPTVTDSMPNWAADFSFAIGSATTIQEN